MISAGLWMLDFFVSGLNFYFNVNLCANVWLLPTNTFILFLFLSADVLLCVFFYIIHEYTRGRRTEALVETTGPHPTITMTGVQRRKTSCMEQHILGHSSGCRGERLDNNILNSLMRCDDVNKPSVQFPLMKCQHTELCVWFSMFSGSVSYLLLNFFCFFRGDTNI